MPKVWVKNSNKTLEGMMLRSLAFILQVNGETIETHCGGNALCGKCAVRVLEGGKFLSPMGPRERDKLEELGVADDIRLACQSHPGKDVRIEIVGR